MIKKNQVYSVQINSHLSLQEKHAVDYLYQPIISSEAFLLYHFLVNELHFLNDIPSNNFNFNRIYQFLNFNDLDLTKAIQVLIEYKLLSFSHSDSEDKLFKCIFTIEKPLLFLEFYKSKLFQKFHNQISKENVESIYFLLRQNVLNKPQIQNPAKEDKRLNLNFDKNLLLFLNGLKCLKNYKLKIQDLSLIQHFYQNIEMSLDIIQILLEFCIFKINSFSKKYLLKIVATLKQKKIINDFAKIKFFFQHLFQNISVEEMLVQNYDYIPQWLIENISTLSTPKELKFTNDNSKLMTKKEFNDAF